MNFAVIDAALVVKLLLLLLIGMGPKVALVPFLEKTKDLDAETQRSVGRRMVVTAVVTAIVLFATGWLLLRLLHISGGAVAVGGAIVLAILAINMATEPTKKVEAVAEIPENPMQIAVYPLAVPYLLNPVGVTILIIASSENRSAFPFARSWQTSCCRHKGPAPLFVASEASARCPKRSSGDHRADRWRNRSRPRFQSLSIRRDSPSPGLGGPAPREH